ncbi:hypothetical protein ACH95_09670 [Bacillus glycinifermentans]|uniref:Uncharacterized protein n=1 Tax=Bacillus glycinifermentans TaxID=1664069 RepID=A0A0J6EUF8_9BACI|nr:hypothetical protein [Bacillus glycinifermentans]KMM60067.1 hypothetical protein ACH95_09670 [Bacillus glycinifermentans]KRT92946.1 hypothetical protein AB447_220640 [Bacillus glycinifermentans]MEC0486571.1 hypothetical protein [Bacillus glycinifermentans]MEC0494868.1 hypothetical protein [Bacillus glycinifermentans]MEC0540988.1 hypothetical protein [Bacillus glycinifermentans]
MNQETYIEISRTSQYINKMRKFSVLIDGAEMGKIKDGGRLRIDLQPGEHFIQVKADWCISQSAKFTLHKGEVLKFRCGSPIRGWKVFMVMFSVLFSPEKHLFIHQE